jgi:hypothetical protein
LRGNLPIIMTAGAGLPSAKHLKGLHGTVSGTAQAVGTGTKD